MAALLVEGTVPYPRGSSQQPASALVSHSAQLHPGALSHLEIIVIFLGSSV